MVSANSHDRLYNLHVFGSAYYTTFIEEGREIFPLQPLTSEEMRFSADEGRANSGDTTVCKSACYLRGEHWREKITKIPSKWTGEMYIRISVCASKQRKCKKSKKSDVLRDSYASFLQTSSIMSNTFLCSGTRSSVAFWAFSHVLRNRKITLIRVVTRVLSTFHHFLRVVTQQ